MHVGRTFNSVPQRRGLEGMLHDFDVGHLLAAADIIVGQSDVVETVIGEVPAGMAGNVVGFAVKQIEPALGSRCDCFLVAADPFVQRRDAADDCAFERGDGFGNVFHRDAFAREVDLEQGLVFRDLLQFGHNRFHVLVHFDRRQQRAEGLIFKRLETTVPHQQFAPGEVQDRRRTTNEAGHYMPDNLRQTVTPGKAGVVAGRAGNIVGAGKARI